MGRKKNLRPGSPAAPRGDRPLAIEPLEDRRLLAAGGGYTDQGLLGTYFNDTSFNSVAFTRRDVRLDFDWGTATRPGGSNSPAFKALGTDNYSVQWLGGVIAKFSESYTFLADADDRVRVELKSAATSQWTTLIDQTSPGGQPATGTASLVAGVRYDLRVSYVEVTGTARIRLRWQSASTPLETIDPLTQSGINNPDGTSAFADLTKGGRNTWEAPQIWNANGASAPALDADGWPLGDGTYVMQESLNLGLPIDPLMQGRVDFSFRGSASISLFGNCRNLSSSYSSQTNTTSGSFEMVQAAPTEGVNASSITFVNTRRTPTSPLGSGITNLQLMRPTAPAAATTYGPGEIFTSQIKAALANFTVFRQQYVANQQVQWSDRTRPTYFNQSSGARTAPRAFGGGTPGSSATVGSTSNNGWSWEHSIMLANETGRDLMLSIPVLANDQYVTNLANLIRYGSDGVNPYTSPQENPVYPPLNSNLHVILELENELWNYGGVFSVDYENLNRLTRLALQSGAGNENYRALTYDGTSTATNAAGEYVNLGIFRLRMAMLRTIQISNLFRQVHGDAAMPNGTKEGLEAARIRPVYEWQYANFNQTAEIALDWADRYFNKSDNASTWTGIARPLNYYLYGGGGATYYGALNGNGLTSLLPNSDFEAATMPSTGYSVRPAGTGWTFTGTAGIARDGGAGDDIPPPLNGSQAAYLAGSSTMTATFTVPSSQVSSFYAVSFKALNRRQVGVSSADHQNLRVYLDYGTSSQLDLTARTFNQADGYTPPDYESFPSDEQSSWPARNVFWTSSQYYYTKDVMLQPATTHTITIRGTTTGSDVAFLENVFVTSVDKIFADGIPGGGEATGQPVGSNIRSSMNVASSWAAAYGLAHVAYEGGWSLGGDDGGSFVQLRAKYGDARTSVAQRTFMDMYHEAGGEVNVFGTYAQWPSWSDYYAQQGLLDVTSYPIMQGIAQEASQLRNRVSNGALLPQQVSGLQATIGLNATPATGRIDATGGWLSYNVVVPRTSTYVISVTTTTGGTASALLDNMPLTQGATGSVLTGSRLLTEGLHTVRIRSTGGSFAVSSLTGGILNAPTAPDWGALSARGGIASLSWWAVRGATGYVIRYGTQPGQLNQSFAVSGGTTQTTTISGLVHDTQYYFGISTVDRQGREATPTIIKTILNLNPGQVGTLANWDFSGMNVAGGTALATAAPSAVASGLVVGLLQRGAGYRAADGWATQYFGGSFSSYSATNVYASTLAAARTSNQFVSFTVEPSRGQVVSLSNLNIQAGFSHVSGAQTALFYSLDGTTFTQALMVTGTPNTEAGLTYDLSGIAALQNTSKRITFRFYQFGVGVYTAVAIGNGTSSLDMRLQGSTRAA